MNDHIFLGRAQTGLSAFISEYIENPSILITGISGNGKSTELQTLEIQLADTDNLIVVINFSSTHNPENINPCLREKFLHCANYINVMDEGLPLSLWTPLSPKGKYLPLEKDVERIKLNDVNNALNILSSLTHLGERQKPNLRYALLEAYPHRFEFENEMDPIAKAIDGLDEKYSLPIAERLYPVLNLVTLKPRQIISARRINVLDISEYDAKSQRMIADLILCILWESVQKFGARAATKLFVVLDEFQGLNLGKDAPIPDMLRQARKYNTGLILSTQTLSSFTPQQKAVLSQPATKLYFKQTPSEALSIAKAVAGTSQGRFEKTLTNLRQGEFIATGTFSIGNDLASMKPLLLRNYLK